MTTAACSVYSCFLKTAWKLQHGTCLNGTSQFHHIIPVLWELFWLKVPFHAKFNILNTIYKFLGSQWPRDLHQETILPLTSEREGFLQVPSPAETQRICSPKSLYLVTLVHGSSLASLAILLAQNVMPSTI